MRGTLGCSVAMYEMDGWIDGWMSVEGTKLSSIKSYQLGRTSLTANYINSHLLEQKVSQQGPKGRPPLLCYISRATCIRASQT
jgi:hypothetical protein